MTTNQTPQVKTAKPCIENPATTVFENQEAETARARALVSECVAIGLLIEDNGYVSVIYDPKDGSNVKWVKASIDDAAMDIYKRNMFTVLEDAIKKEKLVIEQLIQTCFEKGILKEENTVIKSPHFTYVEDREISWSCRGELFQDLLYEKTWLRTYLYNPKSREYLKAWLEAYEKTEKEFPALHEMIFGHSDDDLLFSYGSDDHAIFYFNPDSCAGGQIVHCPFDNDMARRMIDGEDWVEVVAERTQYLADINHGSFFDTIEELIDHYKEGSFVGNEDIATMLGKIIPKQNGPNALIAQNK